MKKVRHVLGISGGKDSAALAIYMKDNYPELDIEYYTCDTGKELDETYQLIRNLEIYLGKEIIKLKGAENSPEESFDHFLRMYGGYLPSTQSRWCTKKLKLEPFEKFVGTDLVVSYVGIRGDEDRDGYISRKSNIQSIFPFRKNIWSEDVISKVLSNSNIETLLEYAVESPSMQDIISQKLSPTFTQTQKLNLLLNTDVKLFNRIVHSFIKSTNYPLSNVDYFPLVNDDKILVRDDIFRILDESEVGTPAYYKKIDFEVNGEIGQYARSRSGCYFCFFQQKIEWVWLYEQHPDLFAKAVQYEKEGYSWNENETLEELIKPERIARIKQDFIKKTQAKEQPSSVFLLDILQEAEEEGCAACFI